MGTSAMDFAAILSLALGLLLGLLTVLFIFRIVLTWYPQVDLNRFPWKAIAIPTEPLLIPARKVIPRSVVLRGNESKWERNSPRDR